MRFRWLAALAVAVFSSGLAAAQPKAVEPTIEVRLRSVNDLVDKFEYVAALAGKEDVAGQVREFLKAMTDEKKGIEGIDPKRPLGAYAVLEKDVAASPFVLMVPIADEAQFLKALETKLGLAPEKGDDGTQKVAAPVVNEIHFRVVNGYLYASPKAKDLDPKRLVDPKAYFERDDGAVVSLVAHIDRIPADLRTFVFGQLELGVNGARKKNADNESPAEQKLKNVTLDMILAGTKGVIDDGKDLSVRLFADPKTDEITAEVALSAKDGTATAKNFRALGSKTSLPAGITAVPAAASRGTVKIGLTDGTKKEYAAAVDALLADAVKKAPEDQQPVLKALVAAVAPTLKAGELDLAASFVGPDAKNHFQLLAALAVTEGKGVEAFVKKVVGDYGAFIGDFVEFKFDVETIGDFNLHRIDLKQIDDKFETIFGTKTVWLAISDKTIALSIEPTGEALRKGLKAKAVPVPALFSETSVAKLISLYQPDLKPDELKALLKDAFGDGPINGKDAVVYSVEGGDQLKLKFKAKGKTIRFGAGLGALTEK